MKNLLSLVIAEPRVNCRSVQRAMPKDRLNPGQGYGKARHLDGPSMPKHMTLLGDPDRVLLDEPTNGLDPISSIIILDIIKEIATNRGVIFIISSHRVQEIADFITHFLILSNGTILDSDKMAGINSSAIHCVVDDTKCALEILTKYPIFDRIEVKSSFSIELHTRYLLALGK